MDFDNPKVYGDIFISDGLVISRCIEEGGSTGFGNMPKKFFFVFPLNRNGRIQRYSNLRRGRAVLNRVGFMMNAASTVECVCPNCTAF